MRTRYIVCIRNKTIAGLGRTKMITYFLSHCILHSGPPRFLQSMWSNLSMNVDCRLMVVIFLWFVWKISRVRWEGKETYCRNLACQWIETMFKEILKLCTYLQGMKKTRPPQKCYSLKNSTFAVKGENVSRFLADGLTVCCPFFSLHKKAHVVPFPKSHLFHL